MKQWKDALIQGKKRVAMPIMTHPGIELTGKRVIDAVKNGELHYLAIKALADSFPTAASTIIMDLTVEAEAFGCKIIFGEHEVPAVSDRLVSDFDSVANLKIPNIQSGRVSEYLKASRLAAENIHDRPVLGGCIGPFSLAGRLFDMTEIMTAAFIEPETITLLLEKCTQFLISYAIEMKKTGINGIIMAEPAAGLLDESMCDQFSSVYVKRVVEAVQDDQFLFILHNCGNTGHLTQSMINTGAFGLHFGNKIDIIQVLKEVPPEILVMGNLDPVSVFKMATTKEMNLLTNQLLAATEEYPNFVLSSGCDTPPGVPVDNIIVFFETIEKFNKNKLLKNSLTY